MGIVIVGGIVVVGIAVAENIAERNGNVELADTIALIGGIAIPLVGMLLSGMVIMEAAKVFL
jgi:hypothetical protein